MSTALRQRSEQLRELEAFFASLEPDPTDALLERIEDLEDELSEVETERDVLLEALEKQRRDQQ